MNQLKPTFFDQFDEEKYVRPSGLDINGTPLTTEVALREAEARDKVSRELGTNVVAMPTERMGDDSHLLLRQQYSSDVAAMKSKFETPAKVAAVVAAGAIALGAIGLAITSPGDTTIAPAFKERIEQAINLIK